MVAGAIAGNISAEATTPTGNSFAEAMRGIKQFYGTTENAVKTQIWTAVSTYVLVAIVKKRLKIHASLYEMLQILSLTMFEQTPLDLLFSQIRTVQNDGDTVNQLNLFH